MQEQNTENTQLKKANHIINRHMLWGMAAGSFPVHLIDTLGLMFIQNDMLKQLCDLYDFDYDKNLGKSIVSSIISSTTAKGISLIFGKDRLVNRTAFILAAGAFTYAMGRLFISYFEKGIALIDIDFKKGEELFDEFFDKGMEKAKEEK